MEMRIPYGYGTTKLETLNGDLLVLLSLRRMDESDGYLSLEDLREMIIRKPFALPRIQDHREFNLVKVFVLSSSVHDVLDPG